MTLPPGGSLGLTMCLLGEVTESRVGVATRAAGSEEWVTVWSRPYSIYGPDPPQDGGWLTRRRNAGTVQTNAERIARILRQRDEFENQERIRSGYLMATYSIATHLDYEGRTGQPDREQWDDEWEVGAESANYRFRKDEFPIYGRVLELRGSSLRRIRGDEEVEQPAPLTAEERAALLKLADDAIVLLRSVQ